MTTVPSPILRAFVPFLFFIVNIFALYLLLRGHHLPGGGFIAGLGSAISWILLVVSLPSKRIRLILRRDLLRLAIAGLWLVFLVATIPLFFDKPLLSHYEGDPLHQILERLSFSTPLLFDIGIYLIVLGVVGKISFSLRSAIQNQPPLTEIEQLRYMRDEETKQ